MVGGAGRQSDTRIQPRRQAPRLYRRV